MGHEELKQLDGTVVDPTGYVGVHEVGDVIVSMWVGENTKRQWRWFADRAEQFAAHQPQGIVHMMIVYPGSPPPDGPAREILTTHFKTLDKDVRRVVAVVVGDSFRTTMVRSIARSFLIISGHAKRLVICDDTAAGVRAVREVAEHFTPGPAELSGIVQRLEATMLP